MTETEQKMVYDNNKAEESKAAFSYMSLSAVRYCIEHKTYMPQTITDNITDRIYDVEYRDLKAMATDVGSALTLHTSGVKRIGTESDFKTWSVFFGNLSAEMRKREESERMM